MEEVSQTKKDKKDLPPFLYKYRTLGSDNRKWIERIFTHNEVYFPSPSEFNDPFDCRVWASLNASPAQFKNYLNRLYKKWHPEWNRDQRRTMVRKLSEVDPRKSPTFLQIVRDAVQNTINNLGVFCLSERPDHILMWSHYSAGHTGFCLEFKADRGNQFFARVQKVQYSMQYPVINLTTMAIDQEVEVKMISTKAPFWEYEQEWCVIRPSPGVCIVLEELLTGIILGCQMPEKDEKQIREWIELGRYRPRLYRAKPKEREFGLDILAID